MNPSPQDKVGSHKNVLNRNEKSFKKGSLMFIEGETSTEMYILRSGKVRILKQEGEASVELAILGPGSVLGELSLLDHQPRGATAQVAEDLIATAIDDQLFEQTIQKCPSWLSNMVRVVVKRLRDTMKKTSSDLVRKNVAGVIRVLLLMHANEKTMVGDAKILMLNRVKEMIYVIIGLGGAEAENVFMHLILKDLMLIRKNEMGQEYIVIKDPAVLLMYMNYQRAKQRGDAVPGESISEKGLDLMGVIQAAGPKSGKKIKDAVWQLGLPQLELELDRMGKGRRVDADALDELKAAKVIVVQEDPEARLGRTTRTLLMFNTETIERLMLFSEWLPVFREEIQF